MPAIHSRLVVRSLAGALLAACATGGLTPTAQDTRVITGPELRRTHAAHVYDAVQRLHPEYFWGRGPSSVMNEAAKGPAVFVDRMFLGPISVLVDLPIADVELIRFINAWDAATTYGGGYPNGVIEVTTRRGGS
jgi:hypothetical protein